MEAKLTNIWTDAVDGPAPQVRQHDEETTCTNPERSFFAFFVLAHRALFWPIVHEYLVSQSDKIKKPPAHVRTAGIIRVCANTCTFVRVLHERTESNCVFDRTGIRLNPDRGTE